MFRRFGNTLARFMYGRYGNDQLNRFLLWVYFGFWVVSLFFRSFMTVGLVLTALLWTLLGWMLFRMLSRNISRRQAENRWYLHQITRLKDIRRYRYRRCPHCRGMLRLPIKRGRRTVTCHRCRAQFKAFFL